MKKIFLLLFIVPGFVFSNNSELPEADKKVILEDDTPRFFLEDKTTRVLFSGMNITVKGSVPLEEQRKKNAEWVILASLDMSDAELCVKENGKPQKMLTCWQITDSSSLIKSLGGLHFIPDLPDFPE